MNLAASFVASCPTYSTEATSDSVLMRFLFIKTVGTVAQTFTNRFRPRCHSDFQLRLVDLLLTVETNPSAIASVYSGSCVQEEPSAFHPTFLCRNSTDVKKPGPMRSQIFTLNTSRINCWRPSACQRWNGLLSAHQVVPALRPSTNMAPAHFSENHDR